jgi:hypothetical protein
MQTTASSGYCSGQTCRAPAGLGLPNSYRQATASEDIGFHSATGCSQPGMLCVGTNALEMNVIGRNGRKRKSPQPPLSSAAGSASPDATRTSRG